MGNLKYWDSATSSWKLAGVGATGPTGPSGPTGPTGTFTGTASRAIVTDGAGAFTSATTTATEIGYVNGVTSGIQSQLNNKANLAGATFTGNIAINNGTSTAITTTGTTAALFNAGTSTINAFGEATTLNIGSTIVGSKTLNLFSDAAYSSHTKNINIGTNSTYGAQTNMNFGSAVSGAVSYINFNGITYFNQLTNMSELVLSNPLSPDYGGVGTLSILGNGGKSIIVNNSETGYLLGNHFQVVDAGTVNVTNSSLLSSVIAYYINNASPGDYYKISIIGSYINNSGASRTLGVTTSFGGSTVHSALSPSLTASANPRPFKLETIVHFDISDASVQRINTQASLSATAAVSSSGAWSTGHNTYSGDAVTSVNTSTTAKMLDISFQHSSASASLSIIGSYRVEKYSIFGVI